MQHVHGSVVAGVPGVCVFSPFVCMSQASEEKEENERGNQIS